MTVSDEQIAYMQKWASQHGALLQLRGEVGFGRPCVGVVLGNGYLDFLWTEWAGDMETTREIWADERVKAFRQAIPEDAYHKHPCMAVLVHGDDYGAAIVQLYHWIKWCDENGWGVIVEDRKTFNEEGSAGAALELLFHGTSNPVLRPV